MFLMRIWCVEDDPVYSKFIEYGLKLNPNYEVYMFSSGTDMLKQLPGSVDVITLDYRLPDLKCEKLIKEIKTKLPDLPIIVISAQEDIATAVELLKVGVYDYIVKNEETKDRLLNTIKHLGENIKLKEELRSLRREITKRYDFSNSIKGNSKAMQDVFSLLEKAAGSNITVSISGETGTGKELVAKAIHFNSNRNSGPFVAVNMAAIPSSLVESELFGHERGAFTGADQKRIGKFEEANGGTLFLDEIAELNLNLQAKILRVLQEKEINRIGSNKIIKVNSRVIIATHKNLNEEVRNGTFREDLYYRVLGLPIHLPPLRKRGSDIIELAKYFIDQFCEENGLPKKGIEAAANPKLLEYSWMGNVRELKAVTELACVMSSGANIAADDIIFSPTSQSLNLFEEEMSLKEYTNQIVKHYVKKNNNNVVEAAKVLGVGKSTIYRLIKSGEIKMEN
ncbi:MAG: sigma-54-dependent Fis family transcriptional regulator [Flavobacteriales bacterium]|nr:sigma-54-dependent Fis family transcriptional regulator [Flavobacteriales bacterium]